MFSSYPAVRTKKNLLLKSRRSVITVNYGITFHHLVDAIANRNILQEHSVLHPLLDVQGGSNEYSSPSRSHSDDHNPLAQYDNTLIGLMNSPYRDKKPVDQYTVQFRVSVVYFFIKVHADFQSSVYQMHWQMMRRYAP